MSATSQFWRIRFGASTGPDIWLSEVEFYDPDGDKITTNPAWAISGGDYAGGAYGKELAFDGVKDLSGNGWSSTTVPGWIGQAFPSPVEVSTVRLYTAPQASAFDEMPVPGRVFLEHSSDGVSWTLLDFTFSGEFTIGTIIVGEAALPSVVVLRGITTTLSLLSGGIDSLTVTVKHRIGEVDLPKRARVSLLREKDKVVVRQAWSDPATGEVVFSGLDTANYRYLSLAEYPTNPANPSAENYVRPVAGVSKLRGEA